MFMVLRSSWLLDRMAVSKSSWFVRLMSSFSESRYLRQKGVLLEGDLEWINLQREEKLEGGLGRVMVSWEGKLIFQIMMMDKSIVI